MTEQHREDNPALLRQPCTSLLVQHLQAACGISTGCAQVICHGQLYGYLSTQKLMAFWYNLLGWCSMSSSLSTSKMYFWGWWKFMSNPRASRTAISPPATSLQRLSVKAWGHQQLSGWA
jgi:hypothetical protein